MMELCNLGTYDSFDGLWAAHPEGGIEGDYATVDGVKYHWNKYGNTWGDPAGIEQDPATGNYRVAGDLTVANDLTVAGSIRAKEIVGYATQAWVKSLGYITSASLSSYATQAWVQSKLDSLPSGGSGGNASQAETLANPRKLWGNSFDGSRDINGLLDASANGIRTNKITFTNGATLETDGDVLKFSSGVYSLGEMTAYGKGASGGGSGSDSGGGSSDSGSGYPLLTSWSGYDDSMANTYALSAGLGRSLYNSSHSHSNKSTLDSITSAKVAAWDAAASGSSGGGSGSSYPLLTSWSSYSSSMANTYALSAGLGRSLYNSSHSHSNKSTLDSITSAKVAAWDAQKAKTLVTARSLWGNSFDGSSDINGLLDASTNGIKTNKITFTNGATLETDGDVLKFSSGVYSLGEMTAYGQGVDGSGYRKRLVPVYNNSDPSSVRLEIKGYNAGETGLKICLMRNLGKKLCFRKSGSEKTNIHTTSGWRHPLDGVKHSWSKQNMVTEWNVTSGTWEMSAATIFNQFKGKGTRMNRQSLAFDHRIRGFGFALYKDGVRVSDICAVDVTVAKSNNTGAIKAYPAL